MMEGQGGTWIPHQVLPLGQKQSYTSNADRMCPCINHMRHQSRSSVYYRS